jgi:hypothetical protein
MIRKEVNRRAIASSAAKRIPPTARVLARKNVPAPAQGCSILIARLGRKLLGDGSLRGIGAFAISDVDATAAPA